MAQNIGNITTSQTFENWFTKTNDLVDALALNVMTASESSPETTAGDAILTGTFSATNISAATLLSADTIGAVTGGGTIGFNSPVQISGAAATVATFLYTGSGGQTRYSDGSLSWDVGLENSSPGNFIIDTGAGANKFELSTAGTLTVPNAVITENLTVGSLTIGAGGAGLSSDDVAEGSTNLYYTDARSRLALTGATNVSYNNTTGAITGSMTPSLSNITMNGDAAVDGLDGDGLGVVLLDQKSDTNFLGESNFVVKIGLGAAGSGSLKTVARFGTSYSEVNTRLNIGGSLGCDGTFSVGSDDDSAGSVFHGNVDIQNSSGTVKVRMDQDGDAVFAGDVTSNGSASDRRLKENIVPMEKGLAELNNINTYMFNYKDKPGATIPGVIAQEIEEILPEVVYNIEMDDDSYKAVRYQQIVPLLINAVKELSEKVIVLENRLKNESN